MLTNHYAVGTVLYTNYAFIVTVLSVQLRKITWVCTIIIPIVHYLRSHSLGVKPEFNQFASNPHTIDHTSCWFSFKYNV